MARQPITVLYGANGKPVVWQTGANTTSDADRAMALVGGLEGNTARPLLLDASGRQIVVGAAADGAAVTGNPVLVAGQDGTNAQSILTDTSGRQRIIGAAASGAAVAGDPVRVAGSDGTDTRDVLTDTAGRPRIVGAGAAGAAVVGDPVRVAGSDGTNARDLLTDTAGRPQVVLYGSNGKPVTWQTNASTTSDADRAMAITGGLDNNTARPFAVTGDGRLLISSTAPTPPASTSVKRVAYGTVANSATVDDIYTITNGTVLLIQNFVGGGESTNNGGRIELHVRANSGVTPDGSTLVVAGYISGGNFAFDVDESFTGDGSRQVVLRRINQGGTPMHMFARWKGYET